MIRGISEISEPRGSAMSLLTLTPTANRLLVPLALQVLSTVLLLGAMASFIGHAAARQTR